MRRFILLALLSVAFFLWVNNVVYPSRAFVGANPDVITMTGSATGALDITGDITVSAWIYPTSTAGTTWIINKNDFATTKGYAIFQDSGVLKGRIANGIIFDAPCSTINANQWQNVNLNFNSTTKIVNSQINGVYSPACSNSVGATLPSSAVPVTIGASGQSPQFPFTGRIAEVAVWNALLLQNELISLANCAPPNRVRPQNLVGYWPLYGFASPEVDLSGQLHLGTLTGTTAANHPPCSKPGGALGPTH